MRPITAYIADLLIACGVVQVQSQIAVGATPIKVTDAPRQGAFAKTEALKSYDPDAEMAELLKPVYRPFDMTFEKDLDNNNIEAVSATLYEVSKDGSKYRLHKYTNKTTFLEAIKRAQDHFKGEDDIRIEPPWNLRESKSVSREEALDASSDRVEQLTLGLMREGASLEEVRHHLRESFDDGGGYGQAGFGQDWEVGNTYGTNRDANSEYIPLIGGPWSKQLYLHQFLEMHAKAFEAYNHNPYAHQMVQLTTLFTLGRGIDHTCNNPEVDEIVREFVDRTEYYTRLETIATDTWWSGENITEFYDDTPKKGQTDFRTVDPSTIWEIVTDPEDIRKVYYAHQQYSTPYQLYVTGVSSSKQPISTKYIIRQIPANNFMHWKLNVSDWEKRGRSDLFSVLGWLKRLKDLLNARVIKGQLEAAFVWDITIKTGDADVESIGLQLPDPYNPGATFIHNNAIELKPQSSQIRATEAAPDIQSLLGTVATGGGTSVDFLGGGGSSRGGGNRGTVLARTEPVTKKYESRQILLERYSHKMMDRVIANAVDAGNLDPDDFLQDARSVKRLADPDPKAAGMDEQRQDMEDKQDEFNQQQQEQQEQQRQDQMELGHAAIAAGGMQNGQPSQNGQTPASNGKPSPTPLVNVNRNNQSSQREADKMKNVTKSATGRAIKRPTLNEGQKRRIKAIKDSGLYSRELIEFTFPAIAQEDRAAKLKDLALAEAMEWLPKSITATMAAKELNITTYEFTEMWAMIVQEAKDGMSIAHVFGQDNKHVPDVVVAQGVQEEMQAEIPVNDQPILNVPTPPAVAGMKQEPNPALKGGGGGKPGSPGSLPMSGSTKVNQHASPVAHDPTAPSAGGTKAAESPFTGEGRSNMRNREASVVKRAIYTVLLKEAIKPLTQMHVGMARYLLENADTVAEFEEAVADTETMRIRDDETTTVQ
jgi:hypothetical protein